MVRGDEGQGVAGAAGVLGPHFTYASARVNFVLSKENLMLVLTAGVVNVVGSIA